MINHTATIVNLAKSLLSTLDKSKLETPVQTETLRLLLESIIELCTPQATEDLRGSAVRAVMGHTVAVEEAVRAQNGEKIGYGA